MSNPHTPSFPVETKKSYCEVSKQFIDGCLDEKKFKEFIKNQRSPKEIVSDDMVMPSGSYSMLWRPNNYRRQITVKTKTDDTLNKIISVIKKKDLTLAKVTYVRNYSGCLMQYGKNTLTAILSQKIVKGCKEIFLITSDNPDEIFSFIESKKTEFEEKMDKALNEFSNEFNIFVPGENPIHQRGEDFWRDSGFLSKLPKEAIIYENDWKKVYSAGIETQTGKGQENTEKIRNLISNSMLHQVAPGVEKEIKLTRIAVNPLIYLKKNINVWTDVFDHEELIRTISKDEQKELFDYLFTLENG